MMASPDITARRASSLQSVALLFLSLFFASGLAARQDDKDRRSELGERQRLVARKMAELESRFEAVAFKLEAKEPERAKRLVEALQKARQDLITVKMEEITKLLDENRFAQAEAELDLVIVKLDELVRLLLDDKSRELTRQQEIDKLEKWKEELGKLRNEEEQQRKESDKVANKDETLRDLAGKIAAVEELIRKQKEIAEKSGKLEGASVQAHEELANRQFDVRNETSDLAKKIAGENAASNAGEGDDKNPPPEEGKQDPAEPPKDDNEKGEKKGGEKKAGGSESKGSNSKKGDASSGDGNKKGEPGQRPLESAAKNQAEAEGNMASQKATDAKRAADKAVDDLNTALEELKKEQRRISSLPPEAFKEMAQTQKKTEKKTDDVARDMEQTPAGQTPPAEGEDGKKGGSKGQQQGQPGQQSVQRAQKAMQNAAEDLGDEQTDRATRQQQKAVEELDKALREIEERLDQLREETREEKLARLEARFREMLARQRIVSIVTNDIDEKKVSLNRVRNRDVLGMMRLGSEETDISELGQQAYDLLLEDGTSIVFPEMVQVIREDLNRVAEMLDKEDTGQITQLVQREIEAGLTELLEALKKSKQEGEGGGGGGGGGGNQPLLKKSAEFKMLRAAQLRVNRLTQQFDLIRGEGKLGESLGNELENIRSRQSAIVEMLVRIMEKE
jgi:hypothetical protein